MGSKIWCLCSPHNQQNRLTFCQLNALRNGLINNSLITKTKFSSFTLKDETNDNSKTNIVSKLICDKSEPKFSINKHFTEIDSNNFKQISIETKSELKTDNEVKNNSRHNLIGIEMISSDLHKKIFGQWIEDVHNAETQLKVKQINDHLKAHQLKLNNKKPKHNSLNDLQIENHLPKLFGQNLLQHFEILGQKFSDKYKELAFNLINNELLDKPKDWVLREGWTRYAMKSDGVFVSEKVDFPLENDLVFDVEVCMNDSNGQKPTLATAVSSIAWYSWCSKRLVENRKNESLGPTKFSLKPTLNDMIPMGSALNSEKLIIGHNVCFDRSYIKEQYSIEADKTRFMDTLSLHMCISGLTQHQRTLSYSKKSKESTDETIVSKENNAFGVINPEMWDGVGSLNNLVDVYGLYCDNKQVISKDPRNVFIKGSISDVFDNFQDLMTYCATDVQITHQIFKNIFPLYLERFPHPITLAGMLEMSIMYLPVILKNWNRYVSESHFTYDGKERELNLTLRDIASEACSLAKDRQYTKDVWLWDLDWTTQSLRFKKNKSQNTINKLKSSVNKSEFQTLNDERKTTTFSDAVSAAFATRSQLKKVQPIMPGYPKWYVDFCGKNRFDCSERKASQQDMDWEPGPYRISTQMRTVPKLMRLMWNGYPLHYDEKHGWGYLKPDITINDCSDRVAGGVDHNKNTIYFPMKEFTELVEMKMKSTNKGDFDNSYDSVIESIEELESHENNYRDIIYGCLFCKLPHKGGPDKRVGNPLSKDFIKKVSDGTLSAYKSGVTNSVLNLTNQLSYWKNASKRIESQIIVPSEDGIHGAILPRVIVAGTVTRRAVEPTWLTASNALPDRLGSELKGMIQCPEHYNYVGADVDSQELWIASLIGDSHFSGIHGSTGIGWMTLQGNKSNGTDMHSKTASSINISREQAKVLNYARIYGSGQAFAARFLMQSNPELSEKDAKEKAKKLFTETKGSRKRIEKPLINTSDDNTNEVNGDEVKRGELKVKNKMKWFGGTESHMFNKLEEIAISAEPKTPVLDCRISRSLEPRIVRDNYITSRVNWVVQSSAVDFLHIMLITMKWLMEEKGIEGRFSISIHDELRYLIKSEHKYSAALSLQLSNLLTRSFFAYKLGLKDLPLSVAFFSSVDIDKCLRKEVNLDCKSPSNPLGLDKGYGIPFGESLDIFQLMKKIILSTND